MSMKKYYVLLNILLIYTFSFSQVNTVTFLNTGQMNVAPGGYNGVALYVPDAMRVSGSNVLIVHNGNTELGGNFFQDSHTHVFDMNPVSESVPFPTTPSVGTFRFVGVHSGTNRYITTLSEDITTFNRALYYIAMPHIEIATTDSIVLPGRMGIDAKSVKRHTAGQGFLILRSEPIDNKDFDASMRITELGASASLVDLGCVVVERDMSLYRSGDASSQSPNLFGFATPYLNTQLSGYYAGNWVRKPEVDPVTGHTRYVLGNKPDAFKPTFISKDQYVIDPRISLEARRAYLIQPRPTGFNYQTLKDENGLVITGDTPNAYNKGKFYFNGKVYMLPSYQEQIFAENTLFNKTLSTPQTTTVNWLIGNSYTSPLSTKLIAKKMEASGLTFAPYMYIFPGGSTSYQPLPISGTGDGIVVSTYSEIPAMSIFMIRVSNTNTGTGTLTIGKEDQVQGNIAHNVAYAPRLGVQGKNNVSSSDDGNYNIKNQIIFKVTPEDNENIYDLAAIGLREGASLESDKYDAAKVPSSDYAYQLYTLSATNTKLAANGVPLNADSVTMSLKPASEANSYTLSTQYLNTLSTEGVWLEDLKENTMTDLIETPEYKFVSLPTDSVNRFVVYFKKPSKLIEESNSITITAGLDINGNVVFRNLNEKDIHSRALLYDVSGKILSIGTVDSEPIFTMRAHLDPGVYVARINGKRNVSVKIIKKDNK